MLRRGSIASNISEASHTTEEAKLFLDKIYNNKIKIISDEYNEFIFVYENINLRIEVLNDFIFNQKTDIIVVPINETFTYDSEFL